MSQPEKAFTVYLLCGVLSATMLFFELGKVKSKSSEEANIKIFFLLLVIGGGPLGLITWTISKAHEFLQKHL